MYYNSSVTIHHSGVVLCCAINTAHCCTVFFSCIDEGKAGNPKSFAFLLCLGAHGADEGKARPRVLMVATSPMSSSTSNM